MINSSSSKGNSATSAGRIAGPLCLVLGLLLVLASFGGAWGPAYGQTVVTPTPPTLVADPRIVKLVDPGCCIPGDDVTFTIIVTNEGSADAHNVVVTDTLPAELVLLDVTTSKGTVTIDGNSFQVDIGTVSPGEVVTIIVQARVLEDTPVDIIIINVARMRSDEGSGEASVEFPVKEACETPSELPPTGSTMAQPSAGFRPGLLLAGLLLLVLGTGLNLRARRLGRSTDA
ncbi:MAG: DUF11 domain-containing protein [Chloroflexia bacterium]|nr:DUF11 domain-containing protein [Chloroflexia bacterium]